MPLKKRTGSLVMEKMARGERHVFNALFITAYALVLAGLWWPMSLPGKPGWPCAVLLVLAVLGTIAALTRHLSLQNILLAALAVRLGRGAVIWLDSITGIPFGQFTIGDNSG